MHLMNLISYSVGGGVPLKSFCKIIPEQCEGWMTERVYSPSENILITV